ncbi:MAG: GDSL-type esterase/lipase family protein [Candidatus Neomarinimicrobiota bacterium]
MEAEKLDIAGGTMTGDIIFGEDEEGIDARMDAVKTKLDDTIIAGEADPTSETVGALGQLYKNSITGELFKCNVVAEGVYTWGSLVPDATVDITMYRTPYNAVVNNPDQEVFLSIGDSLTATGDGYTYFLNNILHRSGHPEVEANRLAVSGYRVGDMYGYAIAHLDEFPEAQMFTILLGTNDTKTTSDNTWFDRMNAMYFYFQFIRYLKKQRPGCEIRVMQIPWISPSTTDSTFLPADQWEANKDEMNRMIRSLARNQGMPEAPDLYALTEGKTDYYLADGLHFNTYGYKHLAPIVLDLLKQVPSYTADRDYLTGKDYVITGGVQNASYLDWAGTGSDTNFMKKLTKGDFYTLDGGTEDMDNQIILNDQIGFGMADNGGDGATITVDVEIPFDEEVVLNDVLIYASKADSAGYTPSLIKIYSYDGAAYHLEGTLDPAEIRPAFPAQLLFFNAYLPDKPFKTKGLKITFEKTFAAVGGDWFFIGEIAATKLNGYTDVMNAGHDLVGVTADDTANTLTGMAATMEFSTDDGSTWTTYNEDTPNLPDLTGELDILVRFKETATHYAGAATEFNFTKVEGPALSGVTADDTANTLTGMAATMEFSTDEGSTWTTYDEGTPNLPDLSGTVDILVRFKETATLYAGAATEFNFTA